MSNHSSDRMDDGDLNDEQIVQAILDLGNDILKNLGVEERIDDVGVFFSDAFYIQFFQAAFPDVDFSQLEEAENEEEMAENIQSLIDLLGDQILKHDLSHIKGEEIVAGNPEHCINLLQLVHEISVMLDGGEKQGGPPSGNNPNGYVKMLNMMLENSDDEAEEDQNQFADQASQNKLQMKEDEDDEAQLIQQRKQKQENISPLNPQSLGQASSQKHSQKKGRSFSDDRGKPQFELDDIDISNEFDVNMDDDDDDEDDDDQMMFQQNSKQGNQQKQQLIDDYQEDDEEEDQDDEIDEEDLKMYEQFLENNKQQEHQLAMLVNENNSNQQKEQESSPEVEVQDDEDEDNEDDGDIDLDNIDYDDLDPQILELAEQMGVHPREVIKQMIKMQKDGYGDEDGEEYEDEDDDNQQELYQQKIQQSQQKQKQEQQQKRLLPHEMIESNDDSYYSEGELLSKDKLANKKSYSAPYIIINDCYDEALYDSDDDKYNDSANTTTILKNLELQEQLAQQMGRGEDESTDQEAQMMIMQQQQQEMQQQQQQKSNGKKPADNKDDSKHFNNKNSSSEHKRPNNYFEEEDDEDELEIDVGQKLQQLQSQQNNQFNGNQQQDQDLDEGEGEGDDDDDDEDMLIDLDQLDETNKQMLLEYLQQEYEKNPDQFPFPKELLEQHLNKQQQNQQSLDKHETESVRDIKSDEMIVEDMSQQKNIDQIQGGEQEVESQFDEQDQQYQEQQDYGEENNDDEQQLMLMQQLYQQQLMQQQQQQLQQQPKAKKGIKKSTRPKSATRKKQTQPQQYQQQQQQQQMLQQEIMLDPEQQQMLAQLIQDQQIDIENLDPNILQQLIVVQSQQRPKTAKRKTSATKRKPKNLQKLLPYQAPKTMKILAPSTPGMKAFNTNRSLNQHSKKKIVKRSAKKSQLVNIPSQNQYINHDEQQQIPQMPMLSEEYLNQLSEDQLQQLLEQQQQLMIMQQQQQQQQLIIQQNIPQRKSSRPKSAKAVKTNKQAKIPQSYATYYQPTFNNVKRKSLGKGKKKKKKKSIMQPQIDHQGVLMNNYFPALEAGGQLIGNSQMTDDGSHSLTKDSKYPKFSHEVINNPSMLQPVNQEQIDEVSPEQEEGESQELAHQMPNFYPPQQLQIDQDQFNDRDQDQDIGYEGNHDQDQVDPNTGEGQDDQEIQLSDEQLIQLIQNAHNLSPDQQNQLQLILQQKIKSEMLNERAQSYENIYQILMDNVRKAKDRLANLAQPTGSIDDAEETDRRILRQKQEFEALYRQYQHDVKQKESKKRGEDTKVQRKLLREQKIQTIKEKKFQDELFNHQKSLNYKRNAQQVRLCQKVYKLASDLEKNKLLAEKKEFKDNITKKKQQSKLMIDALENYYKNMIDMLKEKIETEKIERRIAQQAQQQAMARMKKELNQQKKLEVERYLQLLKQEDQRYDFESTNLQKIEQDIIRLYKK